MSKQSIVFNSIAALLLCAAPSSALNQIWVVGTDDCPDIDFPSIQEAIDAAAEGDTIVIQPGATTLSGGITITQKSLTIIASERKSPTLFRVSGNLIFKDLLPSQQVTIVGVPIFNGGKALLRNNQGSVWIENAEFEGSSSAPFYLEPNFEKLRIKNCESVNLINCNVQGPDAEDACQTVADCFGQVGGDAVLLINSEVNVYGGFFFGGEGERGNNGTPYLPKAGTGGSAFRLRDSLLNFYSGTCFGGEGGLGGANNAAPNCSDGGDGGSIFHLDDLNSQVRIQNPTVFFAGVAGAWTSQNPDPAGCNDGVQGAIYGGPGSGNVVQLPGPAKSVVAGKLIEDSPGLSIYNQVALIEGDSIELTFRSEPFDLIFMGYAGTYESVFDPILMSTIALQPTRIVGLGTSGASGKKLVSLPVGDISMPGVPVPIYVQAYYFDTQLDLALSSPSATVVLDETYDVYGGCSTVVHVDDDAPFDPGPGDPNVSDPLEDGSAAHPFDTIQKARNSLYYHDSTILLADGVYPTAIFASSRAFSLESANGPENCFITSASNIPAVTINLSLYSLKNRIKGITFTGCTDRAILVQNVNVTIEDCVFENNTAGNGAGIHLEDSSSVVQNCIFRSNVAVTRGGGLYARRESPTIANCLFVDNSALTGGGMTSSNAQLTIRGCTFVNNDGGGADFRNPLVLGESLLLDNCIAWGNTNGFQIEAGRYALDIPYGNVEGGLVGIDTFGAGSVTTGPGFINVDPLFVDPIAGDFHLSAGSPCIDAGNPAFVAQSGEVDIDGEARVQGVAIDLGADEF